ncbi:MG2 domain-containing protein [Xylanibacter ruminicola]|uniref:MG2 domain-containing protein n=1 Tax=Xylanibacter ruminicola TaxID=839 RepID=A0A1H4EPI5_XYLRU|nr:alpha-2-macroglobulin family protein [Xylanibacter ruminicola]SEA86975.1 MG2 domain-containing protein [Xylanibacter ruminicola]
MKKFLIITIALIMPMFLFGQSYSALWKQVSEAEKKDLPKTQYEVLQMIVNKADKEHQYGQLLKAELYAAQTMVDIAPDSLKPEVDRIVARYQKATDQVQRLVYQTVLWQIDNENYSIDLGIKKPQLTPELCKLLAATKERSYQPFVVMGSDASVFGNDMLSVIGAELGEYQQLRDYYQKAGNLKAVSIIDAHLAIDRYNALPYNTPVVERIAFIDDAIAKWGRWPEINHLRNTKKELTNPQFHLSYPLSVARPMQAQQVVLKDMRHLSQLTMTVYPVRCEGDIEHSPSSEKGWAKIRPLLGAPVVTETKHFAARPEYELFEDSMTLKGLPVGMYLVEFKSNPATEVIRTLYHVTNVFTIAEAQPDGKIRYEVVNATTGQPIADAHLRIKERPHSVFAYTDTDKAGAVLYGNGRYEFYGANRTVNQTAIFTDRSIYRPGQTVHASAMVYQVENGINQTVRAHQPLKFVLRDANHKVVAEKQTESDAYGVGAVDFTLPAKGLTGLFTIQVENSSQSIRVEEYKRPTFHVDFAEYKDAYKAGDVLDIKGTALSYAGVPVQDAKVAYKVLRRTALWWWSYNRYYDEGTLGYSNHGTEICSGEATTDAEGNFVIKMPLEMPETKYTMFYNFVLQADVTDMAGETHQGQFTLPLGNRPTALSIDLDEKVLVEDNPQATFHLCNAAGKDIDAEVRYRIDGGEWISVRTNQQIALAKLASGKHRVEAAYEDQTIDRTFVVFSLDDEQPATDTDDWFYQSATQFPGDGIPVTIQVGSSDQNVHIFYSIFSGFKLIEQGSVDKSNELINRKFTYQDEYENGLLLTFAWVKNGKCYTHTAQIQRPMPDKKLTLEWATFRDRLTPGQKEEWTLTIKDAKGNPVDANLMATLYDQSLDQLVKHQWNFRPYQWIALPRVNWQFVSPRSFSRYASYDWEAFNYDEIGFSLFDHNIYPHPFYRHSFRGVKTLTRGNVGDGVQLEMAEAPMAANESKVFDVVEDGEILKSKETIDTSSAGSADESHADDVQVRENLNETAFFYPQLTTNANGGVAIKFTLPESLTTWQMLGFAHTCDLHYGNIQAEAVAKKDVMIQPNVPRFIREGDKATISARIFSEKQAQGKATLQLINAETNAIVYEKSQSVSLTAGSTTPVEFEWSMVHGPWSMLIVKMTISGKGFSDGEQHYLPVLPATERVTVSMPITQHQPGTATIDLNKLVPADAKNTKLTLEYTNNPVWLMVQALPAVGSPNDDNAISLAASFYANGLGRYIINQNPQIKNVFAQWQQEEVNSNNLSLNSQLAKNEDLKNLVLAETPWVMDADNETEQKHRLVDFFDENLMNNRLSTTIEKLQKLQNAEGAWTWYPGMPGSFYITVAVSEMLVRLNALTQKQSSTSTMLNKAFGYMGQEMVELVKELKKAEKKGEVYFPSYKALQWLYLVTLDDRQLPADVQQANSYLIELLKKDIKRQSIYDKALAAVIFAKVDAKRAQEYAQSLKEYTVYREDMGRYYDTPRAGYSWFDYKIPTQSIAIEALQQLTPDDVQTIDEMQRWLLQQKRTQAWDTPINSVNAVYAFLKGQEYRLTQSSKMPAINLDVRTVDIPKATAAIGYVKTKLPQGKRLTIRKTTDGTSWGAVYAQFFQQIRNIDDNASGLTIKREILNKDLKVGDRVKVRLTITADRDYDFVQVVDKRAACMEPVKPLSGYHAGAYITPRDNATCYFFGMLSKGTHVIETEYYIDRAGTYETGTATVECAYAPEFRAVTKSETLDIKH